MRWHGGHTERAAKLAVRREKRRSADTAEATALVHHGVTFLRRSIRVAVAIIVASLLVGVAIGYFATKAGAALAGAGQEPPAPSPPPVPDHELYADELGALAGVALADRFEVVPRRRSTPPERLLDPGPASGDVLARIAQCESGGDYTAENPRSSASGKYQALDGTWDGYGGFERAKDAPPEVQEAWAQEAFAAAGTRPWLASAHCWGRS